MKANAEGVLKMRQETIFRIRAIRQALVPAGLHILCGDV